MSRLTRSLSTCALVLASCTPAPLPPPVSQADAVAESKSANQSKEYAPQAFAAAEKLRAEAKWLYDEERMDEAAAAGEEAIAAYNEAFALARAAQAEERIEKAETSRDEAAADLAKLDQLQSQIAADADTFENRARVHLDKEEVKDVESLTPERARVRRTAAKQLTAEAQLLCVATRLLDNQAKGLKEANAQAAKLAEELGVGSIKDDLYPRAAAVRAECLSQLTRARLPAVKKAPESAASDVLLTALTETGKLFAYRDDRGVVVNIGAPLTKKDELNEHAASQLKLLAGVAQANGQFPILLVAHTAKAGQQKRADILLEAAQRAMKTAGASKLTTHSVLGAQPLVSPSLRGASEKNERLEVVFVSPGR